MSNNLLFLHVDSMTQNDLEFMFQHSDYFPGINKFKNNALIIEKMFGTGPTTEMVVPAMFSGELPLSDGGYEKGLENRKVNLISELKRKKYIIQFISGAYNYSSLYKFFSNETDTIHTWSIDLLWKSFQKNYLSNIYNLDLRNLDNLSYTKETLIRHFEYLKKYVSKDNHFYTKYVLSIKGQKRKIIENNISNHISLINEDTLKYINLNKEKILKVSFSEFFYKKSLIESLVEFFNHLVWSGKKNEFPFMKLPIPNCFIETPSKQTSNKRIFNIINKIIKKESTKNKAIISSFYDIHNRNFSSNYLFKFWKPRNKFFEKKFKSVFEDERRLLCLKYFDEQLSNFFNKNNNILQDYTIVITSDHGSVFYKGESPLNSTSLSGSFHDAYLSIPFVVFKKDFKPKRLDLLSSSIDIFPIISDIMNIKDKQLKVRGSSKILNGQKNEFIISEHAHRGACSLNLKEKIIYIGIRTNNFKYIKKLKSHPKDPKKNINEIFIDLKNDKLEKINLINDSTYLETINLFREIYEKRIKDLGFN